MTYHEILEEGLKVKRDMEKMDALIKQFDKTTRETFNRIGRRIAVLEDALENLEKQSKCDNPKYHRKIGARWDT